MAKKFKGKWDVRSYNELTGSSDLNARRKLKTRQRIPYELQRGKKSKFFKKRFVSDDTQTLPIVKLDEQYSFIPLLKKQYGLMLEADLSTSLANVNGPATLLTELSASVFARFSQLPPVIVLLAEDDIEGNMTGSYYITASTVNSTAAYSGIANSSGYIDWEFNNNSVFNTGATWSFANPGYAAGAYQTHVNGVKGNEFHQLEHTGSFVIRTFSSGSDTGSFISSVTAYDYNVDAITDPRANASTSSRIDVGSFHYYTSSLALSTAGFNRTIVNANIFGDGDESTFSSSFTEPSAALYAAPRELITFPYDTVVSSGSFDYATNFTYLALSGFRSASPRPGKVVTLFWASGSGGTTSSRGLSGSITPSALIPDTDSITGAQSGSHIFLDAALTMPASGGYYTTQQLGGTSAAAAGMTIHVAGDGILGNSVSGSTYFTSFASAHDSSASLLTVAPRWNGMSFTST